MEKITNHQVVCHKGCYSKDVIDNISSIIKEHNNAVLKHRILNSYHEGYAVIKEEVDELWEEIKKKEHDTDNIRKEAIQVGAMVLRFLNELK